MRKREFLDQLHYYFRKADKDDFKGILEDCKEQFRVGAEEGLSEEEICCKLGAPRNIYRYYIGKPIIPEENPTMPGDDYYDDGYDSYDSNYYEPPQPRRQPPRNQSDVYDWEKDPDRRRRRADSEQYYRTPAPRQVPHQAPPRQVPRRPRRQTPVLHYESEPKGGEEFRWEGDHDAISASNIIVNPFLQILGTLFYIASGALFIATAAAVIGCIAISSMPLYLYTDLLPLPTLSSTTMIFTVLAILFAALTALYAGQACHSAGHPTKRRGR